MRSKLFASILFILWSGIILTIFFIVQRPIALTVASGLLSLISTIGFWILWLIIGAATGYSFRRFLPEMDSAPRIYLLAGLGFGIFGLLGFGLAAIDVARPLVLGIVLAALFIFTFWNRSLFLLAEDFQKLFAGLRSSAALAPKWIPWIAIIATGLSFVLALAPPVEAFDAYHLTVPNLWLRDGGLRLVNLFPYWYPSLGEGMFVWPLAFHNDIVPQLIHFAFGFLVIILIWDWTRTLWGSEAGWWSIAIFLTMPSLVWLAAWAYTDLMLIFFMLTSLYALWKWKNSSIHSWLMVSGIMAGFATSIKYTSVVLPITLLVLIVLWEYKNIQNMLRRLFRVAVPNLIVTSPWYLRNWFFTGNPVYPFIFGGPFWDSFRMKMLANAGTGIGWNPLDLIALPLNVTLGYRDVTYFDGRLGPFYLILLPSVIWILWKNRHDRSASKQALLITSVFALASILLWTYGVVQTISLWQARLVWPGIISLIIPMTAGILEMKKMDLPKFRLSFIFTAIMAITATVFVLDFGLMVLDRNPLRFAIGLESRQSYMSREQPDYAAALALLQKTPPDAFIYLIDEPRSYGMERRVQPDFLSDNLPHDFYLYPTNAEVISAWQKLGYTHVLLAATKLETFSMATNERILPGFGPRLDDLKKLLTEAGRTNNGSYILYAIPQK